MTSEFDLAREDFGRALQALQPYADDLLVIGGMAAILYRLVPGFAAAVVDPVATREVDWTTPPRLPARGDAIFELLAAKGLRSFEVPGFGNQRGPQVFQHERYDATTKAPVYQEFLCPLRGGSTKIVDVQAGLAAQPLRYLDLLAFDPITITVDASSGIPVATPCQVRLAQPVLYIAQKILARDKRAAMPGKAEKDLAYAFDVASLCRPLWDTQADVRRRAAAEAREWSKWLARAGRDLRALFHASTADGPIAAARIFRDFGGRAPDENEIHVVMSSFIATVF